MPMFAFYILFAAALSTVVLWLTAIFWTRRELRELTSLKVHKFLSPENEPSVSILLPVRNEEKRILAENLRSLLAQKYQNFEIIAINDRSTDRTGEILHEIAAKNSKLKIVAGAELHADWLGKPFALSQGLEKACGEWILTTDADIIFAPETIQTAIAHAVKNDFEVLCLLPFDICISFWEKTFMPTFSWFRMLAMPPSKVNNPKKAETMGVGNFFLVRRDSLERIGDFAAVRFDVAEDLRLAEILKKNGAHFRLEYAPDLLETRMYSSFAEIWSGFTKNFFSVSSFSVFRTIANTILILLFGVLPIFAALFCLAFWLATNESSWFWLFVPFAFVYSLQIALFSILNGKLGKPFAFAFFAPLGMALFAAILANSAIKISSGRGVVWKGREIYKSDGVQPPQKILENK